MGLLRLESRLKCAHLPTRRRELLRQSAARSARSCRGQHPLKRRLSGRLLLELLELDRYRIVQLLHRAELALEPRDLFPRLGHLLPLGLRRLLCHRKRQLGLALRISSAVALSPKRRLGLDPLAPQGVILLMQPLRAVALRLAPPRVRLRHLRHRLLEGRIRPARGLKLGRKLLAC